MIGLVVGLVALLVLAAAAAASVAGRRARSVTGRTSRAARVDLDAATAWVRGRLPAEVGEALSPEDVRRIIDWNLEYFRSRSTAGNGHGPVTGEPVVVAGAETVDHVLARAGSVGARYTPAQVHAVLDAQMRYLEAIGAAGSEPETP